MARENRPQSGIVAKQIKQLELALQKEPYRFGFYQTLRRLQCLHSTKPRIGESLRPADDVVRLAQQPSLAFASSTLASFNIQSDNQLPTLAVNFFGMLGPNGPLPLHLTEYARDRLRNSDDATFSEFLDIFHHRMLSLFYRSWSTAQPTVNFDRPQQDRFSVYTGSLFGLGMPSLRDRDEIPDLLKLHFSGRLSNQNRNAEGLIAMIKEFFKVPAMIEQFVGEWLKLPDSCCCRLGESLQTGSLGENLAIGNYSWQCQQKFRIIVGPLNFEDYESLLPTRENTKCLRAIVRNYVGDSINWDLNLVLKKSSVPAMKLGQNSLLGWNSWLGKRSRNDDANDLILEPMQDMI